MNSIEDCSMKWIIKDNLIPVNTLERDQIIYDSNVGDSKFYTDISTDQSSWMDLASSMCRVTYKITKPDGNELDDDDVDNAVLNGNGFYLFNDFILKVNGVHVNNVLNDPGYIAQTHLDTMSRQSYLDSMGQLAAYYKDQKLSPLDNKQLGGHYQERYDRLTEGKTETLYLPLWWLYPALREMPYVKGVSIEIEANKNLDNKAVFATTACKFDILEYALVIDRVKPTLPLEAKLTQQIADNPIVKHSLTRLYLAKYKYPNTSSGNQVWRLNHKNNSRIRTIHVFFKNNRFDQTLDSSANIDLDARLRDIYLIINNEQYPRHQHDASTDRNRILREQFLACGKMNEDEEPTTLVDNFDNYSVYTFNINLPQSEYDSRKTNDIQVHWRVANTNVTNNNNADPNDDDEGSENEAPATDYTVCALIESEMTMELDYSGNGVSMLIK